MFEQVLSLIKQYDTITVYRHERPDGDAYGSQWGLVLWLRSRYPEKKIYALGKNDGSKAELFPVPDEVADTVIASSLAIVVDTATKERADDKRCFTAQKLIKLDHHDSAETYGDYAVVLPEKSSCAEIIALLVEEAEPLQKMNKEAAKCLYTGILTDTIQFTTTNSSADTLFTAAKLAATGINLSALDYALNKISKNRFELTSELRSKMIFTGNHIGYAYMTREMMERHQIAYNSAKGLVNEFSLIEGMLVWVLFLEDDAYTDGRFNASICSRGPVINVAASHFGGGGHKQAAGTRGLFDWEIKQLLSELDQIVTVYQQEQ